MTAGLLGPSSQRIGGTPPGQLLTGDHNLVNIQVMLDYAVGTGKSEP